MLGVEVRLVLAEVPPHGGNRRLRDDDRAVHVQQRGVDLHGDRFGQRHCVVVWFVL